MALLSFIVGGWIVGMFAIACVVTSKTLKCSRQFKEIRETVIGDGKV